jgi:hypothetical protein
VITLSFPVITSEPSANRPGYQEILYHVQLTCERCGWTETARRKSDADSLLPKAFIHSQRCPGK